MKSDTFKNIANGVQSVILAISIPIAGYWTYSTFQATMQARGAELDYKMKERQSRIKRSVDIDMVPKVITAGKDRIIYTTIRIENTGNISEQFSVSDSQISVFLVSKLNTTTPHIAKVHSMVMEHPGSKHSQIHLEPGEADELVVISHAVNAGLYTLEIQVPVANSNLDNVQGMVWKYIASSKVLVTDT